jgi:hypothetical protein
MRGRCLGGSFRGFDGGPVAEVAGLLLQLQDDLRHVLPVLLLYMVRKYLEILFREPALLESDHILHLSSQGVHTVLYR